VIRSGQLFRYRENSKCERFEKRYAAHLCVREFALGASGTYGLAAGLVGLGIGPGDEVLVPAHQEAAPDREGEAVRFGDARMEVDDAGIAPRLRAIDDGPTASRQLP